MSKSPDFLMGRVVVVVAGLAGVSVLGAQSTPNLIDEAERVPSAAVADAPHNDDDDGAALEVGLDVVPDVRLDAGRGPWADRFRAVDAVVHRPPRGPVKEAKEVEARLAFARRLHMPGADVDERCVRTMGALCQARSLDGAFRAFDDVKNGGRARVVAIGNSLIASDHIIDIIRERFIGRFGNGGRGFVLADRMAAYGRRTRTAQSAHGMHAFNIAMGERGPHPHGLPGVIHIAERDGRSTFTLDGETLARIFWLDHKDGGSLTVSIDGSSTTPAVADVVVDLVADKSGRSRVDDAVIPTGAKRMSLRTERGGAIYGVSLERTSGVIVDTFGVPASDAAIFNTADHDLTAEQIRALKPDLVLYVLGGNEIKRLAWGRSKTTDIEAEAHMLFSRVAFASDNASCIVVGPLENVVGKDAADPFATRWQTHVVNSLYKDLAHAHGCAYFDTFAATGGRGSIRRMQKNNVLHDDLVHPRSRALDAIGELVATAVLNAYDARPALLPSDVENGQHQTLMRTLEGVFPAGFSSVTSSDVFFVQGHGAHGVIRAREIEDVLRRELVMPVELLIAGAGAEQKRPGKTLVISSGEVGDGDDATCPREHLCIFDGDRVTPVFLVALDTLAQERAREGMRPPEDARRAGILDASLALALASFGFDSRDDTVVRAP